MKTGMSIKAKVAIHAIIYMGILTAVIAVFGYKLYYDSDMESYAIYADTVLEYAYCKAEDAGLGDMIAARDMPEGYEPFRS